MGSRVAILLLLLASIAVSKTVVFWEPGFPTIESEPVSRETLAEALGGKEAVFAGLDELGRSATLQDADLLVIPYGSAVPVDAWKAILDYLRQGGNLLTMGGRPLFVPVYRLNGNLLRRRPENAYSRAVGVWHTYEAPQKDFARFAWDEDHAFLPALEIRARRVFVAAMGSGAGNYRGIGFLLDKTGDRVAAPVSRQDFIEATSRFWGGRHVFLNFEPEPGYWSSPDGIRLIRASAAHARRGATQLWLEVHNAALAEAEIAQAVVHLRNASLQRRNQLLEGSVTVELLSSGKTLASRRLDLSADLLAANVTFPEKLSPGHYVLRSTYSQGGETVEVYHTGFWVRDTNLLRTGPLLGVQGDYFAKAGAPFLPFGTNYFSTDVYGAGFFVGGSLAGNAWAWERDFAEMARHDVTFVRTGIWQNQDYYLDRMTGSAGERLLRALEAFLHSAGRHGIHVQFAFFAFDPQTVQRYPGQSSFKLGPGSNPYTDPASIRAQRNYVQSVTARFKDIPLLSWDLINEPSFSNPRRLWRGNTPNADPTEIASWNRWLEKRYTSTASLARAWRLREDELSGFGGIPLPDPDDLALARYGNDKLARAIDYNLFAQDAFNHWAAQMIAAIRSTGSQQLVTVGQDEGGVTNRLLNHFYADSGVSFTVNHTWWRDDALLWGSVAAKRPDMPNLIGETGVQPVWSMDTSWRWDEINALGLFERKMALGFAAANSGALHWDWARGDTFGILRRDGSNKTWMDVLSAIGGFAKTAAPHARTAALPDVAIVLPQSRQLSVFNNYALEAQQNSVRALYHYARSAAYAVGEYQLRLLGNPRLIILPSPWVLHEQAWDTLLAKVRDGATLLVSGRLDADEHYFPTERAGELGLDYRPALLDAREHLIQWPGGQARLSYAGDKTTYLETGRLASGETFVEKTLGKGRILYFTLPLELNSNLEAVGAIYRFALSRAGVQPAYTTSTQDPGILICPARWQDATLYVLTSESSAAQPVSFRDAASGKDFGVTLEPGRAALLLVGRSGDVVASYNIGSGR